MAATGVLAALGATMLTIPLGLDLYMPVPEDNAITPAKVELGRRLFNDRGLRAMAPCHARTATIPRARSRPRRPWPSAYSGGGAAAMRRR